MKNVIWISQVIATGSRVSIREEMGDTYSRTARIKLLRLVICHGRIIDGIESNRCYLDSGEGMHRANFCWRLRRKQSEINGSKEGRGYIEGGLVSHRVIYLFKVRG